MPEVPKEWKPLQTYFMEHTEEMAEELVEAFFVVLNMLGGEFGAIIVGEEFVRRVFKKVPKEVLPK